MRKQPRAVLKSAVAITASLFVAGACAFGGSDDAAVELRLLIWDESQQEAQQDIADAFHEEHPDIKVAVEYLPRADYWAVAEASVTTGAAPDLLWMNGPNFPAFAHTGLLMEIPDGVHLSEFAPAVVELYETDEHVLGVPKDFDTIGLYYNKDLFDAAGVEYPNADWTWADLQAAAAALTTDEHYGFVVAPYAQEYVLPAMAQTGVPFLNDDGTHFQIDEPAACAAIDFLRSFVDDGTAPTWSEVRADYPQEFFQRQTAAMYFDGSWAAHVVTEFPFEVGVTELPSGVEEGNVVHGLAWVALASSPHPVEALKFLEFVGSEEAQRMQSESGTVISARIGSQAPFLRSVPEGFNAQVFFDVALYSHPFPVTHAPHVWAEDAMKVLEDELIAGTPTPDVCVAVAAAARASIAENRIEGI